MLYFAWVREQVGCGEEEIAPPATIADVAGLIDWLSDRSPAHAAALAERDRLRSAVDGVFASMQASIVGAGEVALFPPVTGG